MWQCPNCKNENDGNFCSLCGTKMPSQNSAQSSSKQQALTQPVTSESRSKAKKPKKGFIIILCAIIIVIGATASYAAYKFLSDPDRDSQIESDFEDDENETNDENAEENEKETFIKKVNYDIEIHDNSYKNEDDENLIEHYYHLVVLDEVNENIESINRDLEKNMEEFVMEREELEEFLMSYATPESPFMNNCEAEVTQNADGIFSVKHSRLWFMGGVGNYDHFGSTYDINTGLRLSLSDLTQEDADSFEQNLKDITWEYLESEYGEGLFPDAYDTLYNKNLDEFSFYIDDGEIVLVFSTYELAPGAAGSITSPTGIYIENKD